MSADPTFVSLFAGIGGFDYGLERAGMTCVGQVELHPFCLAVLEKHWPEVPRHNDVRTAVDWWRSKERPSVDIVCGGFPCQDISLAKADRKGLDGERSGLYWEALAFIVEVRPQLVLLENVEGLLSSNSGRDLALIQATLAECGYPYLEWRVLDSQFFGVPQRRKRVFLVASARDTCLGPVLLEPEGSGRHLEAVSKARQKAARAAARLHGEGSRVGGAAGPEADTDGVRATAGLSGRVDHLGETARTLLTSGQRGDQDSDNFVALGAGPDAAAPGAGEPAQLAGHGASELPEPNAGLPVGPLQGSVAGDDPTRRRGQRISAEQAATGHLVPAASVYDNVVTSALTRSSARYCGPEVKTAQANHIVVAEPAVFVKYRNAMTKDDDEAWETAEVSRTLNLFENGDVRTPHAILDDNVQPEAGCGCCPEDPLPDANRFGTCGNAVTTHVIKWIGDRMWDELMARSLEEA